MKGSVKLPIFIDDARKLVNTTQLRAKYLGAIYEAEYCQWQTLHGLGSLMETASLIITPNAYLEGKLLASYPPDPIGDFDVTRATTATRVNSAGFVELVPYNLLSYSEQFENADWQKYQLNVTANNTTAPNGTNTADLITQTGAGAGTFYKFPYSYSSGIYTSSCYFKKGTSNVALIEGNPTSSAFSVSFNLDTQAIVINGVGTVSADIESVGNGWYRCSVVANVNASTGYVAYGLLGSTNDTMYAWGAQLNEGTLKDYQKTETRLNIPRLDYSNGTCPSLLVEPQRTNFALYSSSFDNAAWNKVGATISANNTTSPSGTQDADKLVSANGTLSSYIYQIVTNSNGTNCTYSAYIKKADVQWIQLVIVNNIVSRVWIDLDNEVIGVNSFLSANIENVGNGWYRITASFYATNIISFAYIALADGDNIDAFTGNGTSGVYIWGAQLEAGSYASSYIPTLGASVTRNADVISKTGISSLIGQTEGTIFIDANISVRDTTRILLDMQDGTNNDTFQFVLGGNTLTLNIYDSGVLQASLNGGYCLGNKKIALGYKANDFVLYVDGVQVASDTSGSVPTASLIALGYLYIASGYELGDSINAAALWKQRLTNTQLAQLTTI